jgi:hypothetical protein
MLKNVMKWSDFYNSVRHDEEEEKKKQLKARQFSSTENVND